MTNPCILIVEDEILVARDLEQQLAVLGYTISGIAQDGQQALALIEKERPDLVLMDIRLQGVLDGIATAEAIRNRYWLPVVYLTAHADSATVQRARMTEPFGYILKPFEERELRIVVEMALYKHEAEAKLRASERRYATTLHSIGDAVIATDKAGRVTYMNPVAESLTGWPLCAAQGEELTTVFQLIDEETRQPVVNPAAQVLREHVPVGLTTPTLLVSRQGCETPIDDSTAPILDDQGLCTGVVLIFRDISERRQAEAKLAATEMRLRQAHKMEAIGQLAAGIAHDFNNQLTVINGYCSLLLKVMGENNGRQKYVERIQSAGQRAGELTQQLLAFSRRQMLQLRVLNLNQIATDTEQMLSRVLGENITITTSLDPLLAAVAADPGQLEQVLMNLVVNARDAMPDGGIITLQTTNVLLGKEATQISPDLQPGAYVHLMVEDTGTGMSEEVQAHIFEPFFTTKERGKGTGLGLATAYGIIKQSGGHLCVQSELGRGSTFSIYLPAVDSAPQQTNFDRQLAALPCGAETLLLVEDEEAVRDFASEVLESCGYTVLKACDGIEALQAAAQHQGTLHLLLTDVVMPRMNGWELATNLANQKKGTKVLYMSGYAENATLKAQTAKRPLHLLLKPFTPDALARKVRSLLDE